MSKLNVLLLLCGTLVCIPGCRRDDPVAVSYTHLRAHETVLDLVCRLLLEKKKHNREKHEKYATVAETNCIK